MSLYFAGGEDLDFPLGGNAVTVGITSGTHYRAGGYARCGVYSVGALSNPFSAGAITSCWLTFQLAYTADADPSNFCAGVVLGSTTNKGVWVGTDPSLGTKLTIYKYDGTTKTALATSANAVFANGANEIKKVDLQISAYGASSTLNLYVAGALVATYSGDCTVSGVTNLDSVGLSYPVGNSRGMSEFICASEDTRYLSLLTMAPTGAGTTGDWTGTYADIDETTIDDTDAVYTDTVTQDEQFNATNAPAGSFSVPYVVVVVRASKSAGAVATKVGLGVNHGGTVDPGTLQTLTTSWERYERIMSTNPVTTAAWLKSELDALQINLRSGS